MTILSHFPMPDHLQPRRLFPRETRLTLLPRSRPLEGARLPCFCFSLLLVGGHGRVQLCGLDGTVHIWVELRLMHAVVLPAGGATFERTELYFAGYFLHKLLIFRIYYIIGCHPSFFSPLTTLSLRQTGRFYCCVPRFIGINCV